MVVIKLIIVKQLYADNS